MCQPQTNEMEMKRPVQGTLQKAGTSDLQNIQFYSLAIRHVE